MNAEVKKEMPDMPEFIPSKTYKIGEDTYTSKELAEILTYGIKKIDEQLKMVTNPKKIKQLKDKKRGYLLRIIYNEDIKQYTNLKQ